jgi:tRNA-2-methylthio-N6-dimethylallyladenosine synthase
MMNRTYDREWYMERVSKIYEVIPDCTISSDIIAGFCSETEEEHKDTISIIKEARFIMSYMFKYSERPGTLAAKKYEDDVPEKVKARRLAEIVDVQLEVSGASNELDLGQTFEVLIEGDSKKSDQDFRGRNQQNKMLIFPKQDGLKAGDYVYVKVRKTTTATLLGDIVKVCDTLNA